MAEFNCAGKTFSLSAVSSIIYVDRPISVGIDTCVKTSGGALLSDRPHPIIQKTKTFVYTAAWMLNGNEVSLSQSKSTITVFKLKFLSWMLFSCLKYVDRRMG